MGCDDYGDTGAGTGDAWYKEALAANKTKSDVLPGYGFDGSDVRQPPNLLENPGFEMIYSGDGAGEWAMDGPTVQWEADAPFIGVKGKPKVTRKNYGPPDQPRWRWLVSNHFAGDKSFLRWRGAINYALRVPPDWMGHRVTLHTNEGDALSGRHGFGVRLFDSSTIGANQVAHWTIDNNNNGSFC